MRIIFYDNFELNVPDDLEEYLMNDFFLMFNALTGMNRSKIVGSCLVNFLNTDYENDQNNKAIQTLYEQAVDFCVNINPSFKDLKERALIRRLYYYQKHVKKQRIEYFLKPLNIRYQVVPKVNIEDWLHHPEYFIAEMIESDDIASLLYVVLIKMVENNIYVKKCENCGKYFLVQGRRKTIKYCDNIPEGKSQPCFVLAARQKYKQKLENDSITRAYRSAYKKYNQRVRIGKWKTQDFEKWSAEAKIKLKQTQNGEISEEQFVEWLKESE